MFLLINCLESQLSGHIATQRALEWTTRICQLINPWLLAFADFTFVILTIQPFRGPYMLKTVEMCGFFLRTEFTYGELCILGLKISSEEGTITIMYPLERAMVPSSVVQHQCRCCCEVFFRCDYHLNL